jgi:hypothetical protein
MPEPRYHIIFSALIEGRQPAQVYHDLAELFNIDEQQVQKIFSGQGAVVKRDLDRAAAEQYVQIILAAGAICIIEAMPDATQVTVASKTQVRESLDSGPPAVKAVMKTPDTETRQQHAVPSADIHPEDDSDHQNMVRAPGLAALLLFAGACVPVLSGSGRLYWPWQLIFESQIPGMAWWVVLPAATGAFIVLLRGRAISLAVICAGAVALLGGTVVLWEAALVIPLRILPLDRSGALLFAVPLLGAALCSAACSAMEELGELIMLRVLAACGSLALAVPACAALVNPGSVWGRWSLILLLLLVVLYAVCVLGCAVLPTVPEILMQQVRLLFSVIMYWAPIAVFLAHLPLSRPETIGMLLLAVLKAGLLYYGALAALVCGLRNEFLYRFEK